MFCYCSLKQLQQTYKRIVTFKDKSDIYFLQYKSLFPSLQKRYYPQVFIYLLYVVTLFIPQVWILVGVYVSIAIIGEIILCFVDQLPPTVSEKNKEETKLLDLLFATFKQLRHVKQWLLMPITVYVGMQKGFFAADFTKVRFED